MATSQAGPSGPTPEDELHGVDWAAVERTDEFRELTRSRKKFVLPATIFFLSWYLGFILLAGYAPDFMAESVYEGLTVGYVLALTQFLMVGVLGIMYLRRAQNTFDPLADKVAQMVTDRGDRFRLSDRERDRPGPTAPSTEEPRP